MTEETTGEDFTAKDFRTWAGTPLAAVVRCAAPQGLSATRARKAVVEAVVAVARDLGNTPSVCRPCYVHPAVIEAFHAGTRLPGAPTDLPARAARATGGAAPRRAIGVGIDPKSRRG